MPVSNTALNHGRALVHTAYIVMLALTVCVYATFRSSPALAEDLKTFLAAGAALGAGHDPYNISQLLREEWRMFPMDSGARDWSLSNPYIQGPLLLTLMRPLAGVPLSLAYPIWTAFLALCAGMAITLLPRVLYVKMPARVAAALALSPVTFLGLLLGQSDAIMLLAFVGALWSADRKKYHLAGLLLAVGLIKPQIVLGALVLFGIQAARDGYTGRYVLGLAAGIFATAASAIVLGGPGLLASWVGGMAAFGHNTVGVQANISSLTVLYIGAAPQALPLVSVVGAVCWLVVMTVSRNQLGGGTLSRARWWSAGMSGWLLVTPYAHPHDDILLLPAVLVLTQLAAGRRGAWLWLGLFWSAWWLLPVEYLSALFNPFPPAMQVRGFGLVPVAILLVLLISWRPPVTSVLNNTQVDEALRFQPHQYPAEIIT